MLLPCGPRLFAAKALVVGVPIRGEREVGAPQRLDGQSLCLPRLALSTLSDERIGKFQPRPLWQFSGVRGEISPKGITHKLNNWPGAW